MEPGRPGQKMNGGGWEAGEVGKWKGDSGTVAGYLSLLRGRFVPGREGYFDCSHKVVYYPMG